jgi:hypothetical protein
VNRPSKRAVAVAIALVLAVTAVVVVPPVLNGFTADCPPIPTFHETMTTPEGEGRFVEYEALPDERQAEFERVLDGGTVELDETNRT